VARLQSLIGLLLQALASFHARDGATDWRCLVLCFRVYVRRQRLSETQHHAPLQALASFHPRDGARLAVPLTSGAGGALVGR